MNKILSLLIIVSSLTLLTYTSCSDEDDPMNRSYIDIDQADMNVIIKDDGTNSFSFNTADGWAITVEDTAKVGWVTLSQMNGGRGENRIHITTLPNHDLSDRAVSLTIESRNTKIKVSIVQPIANGLLDIPLDDKAFKDYCLAHFDTNKDGILSFGEIKAVDTLLLRNVDIHSLRGIEYFVNLNSLLIDSVGITELNLKSNKYLKHADISFSKIKTLDLTENDMLEELICHDNPLTKILLKDNTFLKTMECNQNALTSLDVSTCTKLISLVCSKNSLTSLRLGKTTAMEKLDCSENLLASIDITQNTKLVMFDIAKNKLTKVDLSKNTALTSLQISNNLIDTLSLSGNRKLINLNVSNNKIDTLNVSAITTLQVLDVSENKLRKLDLSANDTIQKVVTIGNPNLKEIVIPTKEMVIDIKSDSITTITRKEEVDPTPVI